MGEATIAVGLLRAAGGRGGLAYVIRKEAWPFYTTISGVRLCWELEEPQGPKRPTGAATVASALRGALPPVDLRAVCFVRAILLQGYLAHQKPPSP